MMEENIKKEADKHSEGLKDFKDFKQNKTI